jgi:type I restriction enzyme S subunit
VTWPIVSLGDVALSIRNGIFARRPTDEPGGSRILRISAVRQGRVNLGDSRFVDGLELDQVERFSITAGDLLMTRYNGSRALVGISGIVPAHDGQVVHPDKLIRVVVDRSRVDPRFVNYQLQSPQVRAHLEPRIRTTAGQSGIAGADVRSIPLVAPPIEEQRRIVDLLEDHLSRLDAASAGIEAGTKRLAALRRSALAQLHQGSLTPLGDLAIDAGYGTSAKCVENGPGPAVARIPNLVDGTINLDDEKRIADAETDVSRYLLSAGDVLIVRTNGSVDLIGRSAVVQPGIDAAYASYLIRYRVDESRVRPAWVHAMLSTPQVRARIEALAASSAGQHNLSLGKLNPLELPVPPLADQDAGLRRLAEVQQEASRLRSALVAARQRTARLRSALLAAAFSGRLAGSSSDQVAEEVATA